MEGGGAKVWERCKPWPVCVCVCMCVCVCFYKVWQSVFCRLAQTVHQLSFGSWATFPLSLVQVCEPIWKLCIFCNRPLPLPLPLFSQLAWAQTHTFTHTWPPNFSLWSENCEKGLGNFGGLTKRATYKAADRNDLNVGLCWTYTAVCGRPAGRRCCHDRSDFH